MVATEAEAPAVRALGHLFRITDVYLWGDVGSERSKARGALEEEPTCSCTTIDADSSIRQTRDDYSSMEDLELACQMSALGLPISFSTTKEKRSAPSRGKKKEIRAKSRSADKSTVNRVLGVSKVPDLQTITSSRSFSTNIPGFWRDVDGQYRSLHHDVIEEHGRGSVDYDGEVMSVDAARHTNLFDLVTNVVEDSYVVNDIQPRDSDLEVNAEIMVHPENLVNESSPRKILEDVSSGFHLDEELSNNKEEETCFLVSSLSCDTAGVKSDVETTTSRPCLSSVESSLPCALIDHHDQDFYENPMQYEFGDWRVFWDSYYMRNYFYNSQTQESTWYPPSGLEHLTFSCNMPDPSKMFADAAEEDAGIRLGCDAIQNQDAHGLLGKADLFEEGRCDGEYVSQSSECNSPSIDKSMSGVDPLTASCESENLDIPSDEKKVDDILIPLHSEDMQDHATGEVKAAKHLAKEEENVICREVWNVPDVLVEVHKRNGSTVAIDEIYDVNGPSESSALDELVSNSEIAAIKKKRRVRRLQSCHVSPKLMLQGAIGDLPANIVKYWCQRYLLFSRFDSGIKMDEEGWFSVTPEPIARHHASRCGRGTVIDCFTGVGGNAIQFAMESDHVIAIDIDPLKIDYAQHNAAIYGVNNHIDFIKGDFFQVAARLKGDTAYLSPPWGGPDYVKAETYDIRSMLKPRDGFQLFNIARKIASRVVMFLPRNVDLNQLAELSLSLNPPWALEVEKNFLNGRCKAITAYFSSTSA